LFFNSFGPPSTHEAFGDQASRWTNRRIVLGAVAGGVIGASDFAKFASAQTSVSDIYLDNLGLIVQRDGDGGDTAQREGWAWLGVWVRMYLLKNPWSKNLPVDLAGTLDLLEVGRTGEFRRHPTQGGWKSDPNSFSRDQLVPLLAAMGVWGDAPRALRSWNAVRPCNVVWKCIQGTSDVVGPDLVNLYKRAMDQMPNEEGDKFLALGAANRIRQAMANPDDVGDDLNLIVQLLMGLIRRPSVSLRDAVFAYSKNRPVCRGCYLQHYRNAYPGDFGADETMMRARIDHGIASGWTVDCPRILGALRWYFRTESGGCSALAELYAPIVEKYFS